METPAGMRDFLPDEMRLRLWLKSIIEKEFIRYGFQPMDTPALEFMSLLKRKSSDEVVEQIFKIEGEDIGLRFEHTVSLARVVSSHLNLNKPFKRYVIDKVWRNEEPQKGRYREFIQADADIIGVKDMTAEVELLDLAKSVIEKLGFDIKKAKFMINHREFLTTISKTWDVEDVNLAFRIIDKFDKIGYEGVRDLLIDAFGESKSSRILDSIYIDGDNNDILRYIEKYSKKASEELEFICKRSECEIVPYLVRGLSYYTGPVFEIKISDEIGTAIAGGRYDNLLSMFGQGDYAVGISFGFERLYYVLKKTNKIKLENDVVYVAFTKDTYDYALSITRNLRNHGINVDMNYSNRSLSKQLEYASSKGYKYTIIVGKREEESKTLTLRNMVSGEQTTINIENVYDILKSKSD